MLFLNVIKLAAQAPAFSIQVPYFGDTLKISTQNNVQADLQIPVDDHNIQLFYAVLSQTDFQPIIDSLASYKSRYQLDDWLFYQLVRRTAQQLSPKGKNYDRYTLYKWFLLAKSGYNAQLAFINGRLLFYVQSDENIYDVPLFEQEGKQFVCLNIHDFGKIDFAKNQLIKVDINIPQAITPFSYRVRQIPNFKNTAYSEKELVFNYDDVEYRYQVKLSEQTSNMFNNYPTVDYEAYFNIPMSSATYSSLIPVLQKKLKGMKQAKGVDYLMNFTRHAFMYESDQENFGVEKRLSPEQTLMNDFSDCDDRVALFYYLVKEIYDLPMIVLVYPSHVALAIELRKPIGIPVVYNGRKFSFCEPTPQRLELPIGQLMPELKTVAFQVMYEYLPANR